ncbi:DUF2533 family protein [Bacillus rubiinfantis]|uniref:DUF2533 family protein n=1 Tax=Bacillus rubiinfantis TaxID=1499680 RepID=UPI0005AA091A|nr:DUF2533 family protein [Bacillus rubiinfantis]
MSVHKDLIQHAQKQNEQYRYFLQLDELREKYIEETLVLCQQNKPFTTDKINEVTKRINAINLRIIPERKLVSKEMIVEYANR